MKDLLSIGASHLNFNYLTMYINDMCAPKVKNSMCNLCFIIRSHLHLYLYIYVYQFLFIFCEIPIKIIYYYLGTIKRESLYDILLKKQKYIRFFI